MNFDEINDRINALQKEFTELKREVAVAQAESEVPKEEKAYLEYKTDYDAAVEKNWVSGGLPNASLRRRANGDWGGGLHASEMFRDNPWTREARRASAAYQRGLRTTPGGVYE